jgi:hypothetical protein
VAGEGRRRRAAAGRIAGSAAALADEGSA